MLITIIMKLGILACGIACSIPYAFLFIRSRLAMPHGDTVEQWRKKFIVGLLLRCLFIVAIFWYLLRLTVADRILFLIAFISGFWCIILLSQRRYYGRN